MTDESRSKDQHDLGAVLDTARKYIRRGDGWEAAKYDRLRQHCEALDIRSEPSITVALRRCFKEITIQDLHARDDPGYGALCDGHDLYEARWYSESIKRVMYIKFSLFDGRLIIVSFHESNTP